jgi:tetratricopeptide (TPR) repeat protein
MSDPSTSRARRAWQRQFGQLYVVALIVTLLPHTFAWIVPKVLAASAAKEAVAITAAAGDALVHGRLDEAIGRAEQALSLDPGAERARAIQASALIERFWVQKTDADLRAARGLVSALVTSRDSAALAARGNLALVDGDAKQAVALLTSAVGADAGSAYAQHQLGFALNQAGRPEDALAYFKRAIELAPAMAWVQANLENVLARLQRCEEPIPALIPAARAQCHDEVGVKRYNGGRFPEARLEFERAVQLSPDVGGYRANYAIALLQLGDRAAAMEQATRAKALGVKDHPVFAPLGIR